jgi:hypothetical protein
MFSSHRPSSARFADKPEDFAKLGIQPGALKPSKTVCEPMGKPPKLQIRLRRTHFVTRLDKIAFGILDQNSGESELWIVSSDEANATKILGTKPGRISNPAFVRTVN